MSLSTCHDRYVVSTLITLNNDVFVCMSESTITNGNPIVMREDVMIDTWQLDTQNHWIKKQHAMQHGIVNWFCGENT